MSSISEEVRNTVELPLGMSYSVSVHTNPAVGEETKATTVYGVEITLQLEAMKPLSYTMGYDVEPTEEEILTLARQVLVQADLKVAEYSLQVQVWADALEV